MQHVNLLLKLCPADVIKTDIVPMLLRALESEWEQLQELCLSALPNIVTMIDGPVIKNSILPRMKKICMSPGKKPSGLGVRVNCLLCVAKMLPSFDRWLVFDQILPFLQEVPHSGEPAILMAIIGNHTAQKYFTTTLFLFRNMILRNGKKKTLVNDRYLQNVAHSQ